MSSSPDKEVKSKEEIIKKIIPNGIVNIKGKGDGKPQYRAEIKAIEDCMDIYTKQQSIAFFKWYGVKMLEFVLYATEKIKNPVPFSIPDAYDKFIEEFEGNTVEGLYTLFLEQSKEVK